MDRPLSLRIALGWKTVEDDAVHAVYERFGPGSLLCVQSFGRGRFELTVKTPEIFDDLIAEGLRIGDKIHDASPCCPNHKWVTVRGLPYEASDDVLTEYLEAFGEVQKIVHGRCARFPDLPNGVRRVCLRMSKPLPDTAEIIGSPVRFFYAGVAKACFICRKMDHLCRVCPDRRRRCLSCGSNRHQKQDCPHAASHDTKEPEVACPTADHPPEIVSQTVCEPAGKPRPCLATSEPENPENQESPAPEEEPVGNPANGKIENSPIAANPHHDDQIELNAAINSILPKEKISSSKESVIEPEVSSSEDSDVEEKTLDQIYYDSVFEEIPKIERDMFKKSVPGEEISARIRQQVEFATKIKSEEMKTSLIQKISSLSDKLRTSPHFTRQRSKPKKGKVEK